MEHAAFESPLSDEQLKELGRLVVNCGFAEFLLGFHVSWMLGIGRSHSARTELIDTVATRRKIEILKAGLGTIPKLEVRTLVEEACELINPTIRERNTLLHGIWGVDSKESDSKPIVASTKDKSHYRPEDIVKSADAFAVASRKLKHATTMDINGKFDDKAERLVIEIG
jgi:hypothetical protein